MTPEALEQLKAYVAEQLKAGANEAELRETIKKEGGWSDEDLKLIFHTEQLSTPTPSIDNRLQSLPEVVYGVGTNTHQAKTQVLNSWLGVGMLGALASALITVVYFFATTSFGVYEESLIAFLQSATTFVFMAFVLGIFSSPFVFWTLDVDHGSNQSPKRRVTRWIIATTVALGVCYSIFPILLSPLYSILRLGNGLIYAIYDVLLIGVIALLYNYLISKIKLKVWLPIFALVATASFLWEVIDITILTRDFGINSYPIFLTGFYVCGALFYVGTNRLKVLKGVPRHDLAPVPDLSWKEMTTLAFISGLVVAGLDFRSEDLPEFWEFSLKLGGYGAIYGLCTVAPLIRRGLGRRIKTFILWVIVSTLSYTVAFWSTFILVGVSMDTSILPETFVTLLAVLLGGAAGALPLVLGFGFVESKRRNSGPKMSVKHGLLVVLVGMLAAPLIWPHLGTIGNLMEVPGGNIELVPLFIIWPTLVTLALTYKKV